MEPILTAEAIAQPELEDAGKALILELNPEDRDENGWFVRIQSWYDDASHPEALALAGRRVRVTITPLEDHQQMYARENVEEMLHREAVEAEARAFHGQHAWDARRQEPGAIRTMNPDATLERVLTNARGLTNDTDDAVESWSGAADMAEQGMELGKDLLSLHEWLRAGGAWPKAWRAPST